MDHQQWFAFAFVHAMVAQTIQIEIARRERVEIFPGVSLGCHKCGLCEMIQLISQQRHRRNLFPEAAYSVVARRARSSQKSRALRW